MPEEAWYLILSGEAEAQALIDQLTSLLGFAPTNPYAKPLPPNDPSDVRRAVIINGAARAFLSAEQDAQLKTEPQMKTEGWFT